MDFVFIPIILGIMKKRCQPEIEHINILPEDLIRKILIRLPIRDAVRTSVLSKKWRYAWTELPRIVFDDWFFKGFFMGMKTKIIMAIYQVLLLHRGPLELFELSLTNLESGPETDQFVLVVLKAGVRKLFLNTPKGKPYRLPSSIFTYGQQLEVLDLCSCVFKTPTGFNGFSKLEALVLTEVCISGDAFSSLVSSCPLLEYLFFRSYTNCGCIDLVTPNLEEFIFVGLCESLCFTNAPKLSSVSIATYDRDYIKNYAHTKIEPLSQCMLSGRLPVVKELILDPFYSKYLTANRATDSLVNDLCHVETLILWPMCFGLYDEVFPAICLVKDSKNLKKLSVHVRTENSTSDLELREVGGLLDVNLDHLREFEYLTVSGSKCELQFIELIFAKSPLLQKCLIRPDSKLVGEKALRFIDEIGNFRRASPHFEIVYKK